MTRVNSTADSVTPIINEMRCPENLLFKGYKELRNTCAGHPTAASPGWFSPLSFADSKDRGIEVSNLKNKPKLHKSMHGNFIYYGLAASVSDRLAIQPYTHLLVQ
jgi:hypothetical protein